MSFSPLLARAAAVTALVVTSFIGLAILGGCGQQLSTVDRLDQSLSYYHIHLTSGEIQRAAAYVDREAMDDFLNRHDPERNVFLWEDFVLMSVKYFDKTEDGEKSAVAVVKASVRKANSITIEKKQYREVWKVKNGKWTMVSEEILDSNEMGANKDIGKNDLDGHEVEGDKVDDSTRDDDLEGDDESDQKTH